MNNVVGKLVKRWGRRAKDLRCRLIYDSLAAESYAKFAQEACPFKRTGLCYLNFCISIIIYAIA